MHEGSGSQSIGLRDHSPRLLSIATVQQSVQDKFTSDWLSNAVYVSYYLCHYKYIYVRLLLSTYQHRRSIRSFIGEPLYRGHHWDPTSVLYREASLIQRQIFTQLYVVGTADTVLIREVCLISSVIYREVTLYSVSAMFQGCGHSWWLWGAWH